MCKLMAALEKWHPVIKTKKIGCLENILGRKGIWFYETEN